MMLEDVKVVHDEARHRFEIRIENAVAELTYSFRDDAIIFLHTGVPPALEGNGIGGKLAKAGLEFARANNLKVSTLCWFVDGYIARHPEYQDLLLR